jgi:hypothetical protein
MSSLRSTIAVLLLAAVASAQSLTLDGSTGPVDYYMGSGFATLRMTAPPGAPSYWAFDVDPGPFVVGSLVVPIGFSPAVFEILGGAPMPPSGFVEITFDLPLTPSVDGLTIYSVGGWADALLPEGFGVTNGLATTFRTAVANAGADAATFVGKPVGLDGSSQPPLPPGSTFQWAVSSTPPGAAATLSGADTAFPTFAADTPGSYVVTLSFGGPGAANVVADSTVVDVYALQLTSPIDGAFGNGTFVVSGTLLGPTPTAFEFNGSAVALGSGGSFNLGSVTPSTIGKIAPITLDVTSPSGALLSLGASHLIGSSNAITAPASPAAVIRANGLSLDPLEPVLEQAIGAIDFSSLISQIPPIPLFNQTAPFPPGFVIFSATAQPTSFTYDPTVDVDFTPGANCGVNTALTFTNVVITIDVTGKILNSPYLSTITMTATSAVVASDIVFVQGSNGLEAQTQNTTTTLNGFAFTVSGPLASVSQIGTIQTLLQQTVEAALGGAMLLLPPLLNPLIQQFNQTTFDLSAQGIPLTVGFPVDSFCYDAAGVTVGLGLVATPQASNVPETPVLTHYRSTPGVTPVFGATTPLLGLPYTAAVALNDDALNVLFAATTQLGVLNADLTGALGTTALDAGALATALPGAGFEAFDPATPIVVAVRHTTAPSVELASAATTQGALFIAGVSVRFLAEATPGVLTPIFDARLSATADATLTYDPLTQAFVFTTSNVASTTSVGCNFPGADAGASLVALNALLQPIVAQIATALSGLPIPSAGVGGAVEVGVVGDNAVVYF